MPNISVFSGAFCRGDSVVQAVSEKIALKLVTENDLLQHAAGLSGMGTEKLEKAFSSRTSIFNQFNHEKERSLAFLKLALAELLSKQRLLVSGRLGHLIPARITHTLRVCLIADIKFRIGVAAGEQGLSEEAALKVIAKSDEDCAGWVRHLRAVDDPWSPALYDMIIPMDKTRVDGAAILIEEHVAKDALQPTDASIQAVQDFLLAARTEVALSMEGHDVDVSAAMGVVTLTINKHVLALQRLENELKSIAGKVPGVTAVTTEVGKGYHQADIYRKYDFEVPSKVLLVDDERQFVHTLSERLQLRDMGSAVAFDGESALSLIAEDEPEVMLLDLKMPGIDGIEVLRQVKQTRPAVEVIILTGHGSEADRETCMKLGAFAYLRKPVDIDILSETIKRANAKIRQERSAPGAPD
ncbi:MAG TPA: response regulator [Sulfuricaulis sp.]|nr:response regulator [Sulfuricaulis sp.]